MENYQLDQKEKRLIYALWIAVLYLARIQTVGFTPTVIWKFDDDNNYNIEFDDNVPGQMSIETLENGKYMPEHS